VKFWNTVLDLDRAPIFHANETMKPACAAWWRHMDDSRIWSNKNMEHIQNMGCRKVFFSVQKALPRRMDTRFSLDGNQNVKWKTLAHQIRKTVRNSEYDLGYAVRCFPRTLRRAESMKMNLK
jgi:hypothetical protein